MTVLGVSMVEERMQAIVTETKDEFGVKLV